MIWQTLDLNFTISNISINQVKEIAFLGVFIDEHLTWQAHIANVSKKVSKSIGVIYKSRFCLSSSSLLTLYCWLVYPYLVYCVSVWESNYHSNLNCIFLLQKKIIRIISKRKYDAHTDPIFKKLHVLKFFDVYLFQIGKFMFLSENGLLPEAFKNMFVLRNQIHSHNTRYSASYHLFTPRTNIRMFSLRFQGPRFYNSLP